MKNLLVVVLLLSVVSCSLFKRGYTYTEPKIPEKKDFDTIPLVQYQLIRIDTFSYKHNNIFYFKKNDSVFKVVTKKEILSTCDPLILKKTYSLKLRGLLSKMNLNPLDIGGVMRYGRETVRFERDSGVIWNLYSTPYIRDVCYEK